MLSCGQSDSEVQKPTGEIISGVSRIVAANA